MISLISRHYFYSENNPYFHTTSTVKSIHIIDLTYSLSPLLDYVTQVRDDTQRMIDNYNHI